VGKAGIRPYGPSLPVNRESLALSYHLLRNTCSFPTAIDGNLIHSDITDNRKINAVLREKQMSVS
jgi:hypothetical protein